VLVLVYFIFKMKAQKNTNWLSLFPHEITNTVHAVSFLNFYVTKAKSVVSQMLQKILVVIKIMRCGLQCVKCYIFCIFV